MSAFFIVSIQFLFLVPSASFATPNTPCSLRTNEQPDETVTVSRVYDGDTVKLKDGRKIRIIGINTPEMDSKHHEAEPFAQQATDYVRQLIKKSNTIKIRYGIQKKDHYGRVLAHIFLSDNRNLGALLLQKGLARTLYVPPNDWRLRCYDLLDKKAQRLKIGLWSHTYFESINVETLKSAKPYKSQFSQVSGVVTRIGDSKKNIWINFVPKFAIRINKSNKDYFKNIKFESLVGKKITARGYLVYYPNPEQFRMLVRHPIALTIEK